MANLRPYKDDEEIIRVGGRTEEADIKYGAKHPILLPKRGLIEKIIFELHHRDKNHIVFGVLENTIRQRYFVRNLRESIRRIINACLTCRRFTPSRPKQLMAKLPSSRINESSAFTHCGCDYGGPIFLRPTSLNYEKRSVKYWVAVFVCFSTKLTHIEVVSTSRGIDFMGAFIRFTSRRGVPQYFTPTSVGHSRTKR